MTRMAGVGVVGALVGCVIVLAGWQAKADTAADPLRRQLIDRLKAFSTLKEKQAEQIASASGEKISSEFKSYFDAATRGDGNFVTNRWSYYQKHHRQYTHNAEENIKTLDTSYWSPVLEIDLAYYEVMADARPENAR